MTAKFGLLAMLVSTGAFTTFGCSTTHSPEVVPSRAIPESNQVPTIATPPSSSQSPTTSPVMPVLSNCVLHEGQSDASKRQERTPGGKLHPTRVLKASCSFNAECVARRGEDNPGDGFAYLSCTDGQCSCRLEPLFPPGKAVEWDFQSTCSTTAEARQLLRDHCLKGSVIAE
jgi:hypothetical protein